MRKQESPDREEGAEHTTGEGATPQGRVLRSGDADVPGRTFPPREREAGDDRDPAPAMTGLHETGAADEVPRSRKK